MNRHFLLAVAFISLLAAGACSDDSTPVADPNAINGSWGGGAGNGSVGVAVSLTISSGAISSLSIGSVSQGVASISGVSGTSNVYEFALSSGTEGGFIADSSATHMLIVLDSGFVGAVQKNAAQNLPGTCPSSSDVVGSYSGTGFEADFDGNTTFYGTTTATVSGAFSVSAQSSDGSTAVGTLTSFSTVCAWAGTYSSSDGVTGTVDVAMTRDRQFVGFAGCEDGIRALGFCGFGALNRQ